MKLFINEFVKDYKKITTWLYVFLQLALVAGVSAFVYYQNYEKELPANYEGEMLTNQVYMALGLSSIFILIMFANNITQEYSKGTAKFLYSRPRSRSSILTAKIFLAIFNYILFSAMNFVFGIALNKYVFLKEKLNLHTMFSVNMGEENFNMTAGKYLFNVAWSTSLETLFYIALVLLICIIFKTQILSVIIVIVMYLGTGILSAISVFLITKWEITKYLFVNVLHLSNWYATEATREVVKNVYKLNLYQLLGMTGAYIFLFFVISYFIHARRDITLD